MPIEMYVLDLDKHKYMAGLNIFFMIRFVLINASYQM
jgi:hypothetical protein